MAQARFVLELTAQDREDVRWYLEEYLQYPVDPAPRIAARVESRLAELGTKLFAQVLEANRDTLSVWDVVAGSLPELRVEIAADVEDAAGVPWELLRDPATDGVLALGAGAFVRTHAGSALPPVLPGEAGPLRVLLVICRPGGQTDVPFRSVASHLIRLSRDAREAFQLDVLRPPTFEQLTRVLQQAKAAETPYQLVHFDGHGMYLDASAAADGEMLGGGFDRDGFPLVSPARPGAHGFLVFEDPAVRGNQQLVDGPALGRLLRDTGVPVLVLNACRSAHAGLVTEPRTGTEEIDAHRRVRAYGSLAQEVMDTGVAGVVAMGYNVYVVTAARFTADVYAGLLAGRPLGVAVTRARRLLAANPVRDVGLGPRSLQDWIVPVVYEATPLKLRPDQRGGQELSISLSRDEAGQERAALDPGLPAGPDVGFYGRDETLLALDRAFDNAQVVLLHADAGAGKTSAALEFARWYTETGAAAAVLFTSFRYFVPLAQLLDQIGDRFGAALERAGIRWAALDKNQRRRVSLQILAQIPVLWVWDNVESVAGFPAGTATEWTRSDREQLSDFLRDLSSHTQCKVLATSRRDEQSWLGNLPARIALPPMPMLERLELAQAVARRQTGGAQVFLAVEDWRPLLEFSSGNPLAITILTPQVIRERHVTHAQIAAFVDQVRAGTATVADDAALGRSRSLAASLSYGFTRAFTEAEQAALALLALFQGFVNVDALTAMGSRDQPDGPVLAVAGLSRAAGIALLDRAAGAGLLNAYGDGRYGTHPAMVWYLHTFFHQLIGSAGSTAALHATRAWTTAIRDLSDEYRNQHEAGHVEVIDALRLEEANLLHARTLAIEHAWHDLITGLVQGLLLLYRQTGRTTDWLDSTPGLLP